MQVNFDFLKEKPEAKIFRPNLRFLDNKPNNAPKFGQLSKKRKFGQLAKFAFFGLFVRFLDNKPKNANLANCPNLRFLAYLCVFWLIVQKAHRFGQLSKKRTDLANVQICVFWTISQKAHK